MNINKVGLEAEFLLTNKDGQLVYPGDHDFGHDDFCILGEFRGEPGATREETIANFYKAYYEVVFKAQAKNLNVDIKDGWRKIEPALHAEILRKMGSKSVAQCRNIYNIDILSLSDAEVVKGKVVTQKVSAGLHIHFSAEEFSKREFKSESYEPVKLPINLGHAEACFELYRKLPDNKVTEVTARANRITAPVIKHIVESLDKSLLPEFTKGLPQLKYRNPGFYETKAWGVEYRSLPFNKNVLDNIHKIVNTAFILLEQL